MTDPLTTSSGEPLAIPRPVERPRRNRQSEVMRRAVRETHLSADALVYPLFVHAGLDDEPIDALPGQYRWSVEGVLQRIGEAVAVGIGQFVLFPKVDAALKTPLAEEAYNEQGLIPTVIRRVKAAYPEVVVISDIALDPYNQDGHDGLVDASGEILNDPTVEVLCRQALSHAQAGVDIVAPSDMMDGRVEAIRTALDQNGFESVAILAYTAKYASALYGPFREALDSAPVEAAHVPTHKKSYQMDPANRREAIRELRLDEAQGADIVMVKPAGFYLDVIRDLREATTLPIAAYQVSGEYAMIHAASGAQGLNLKDVVLESLLSIRRAGADIIFTYDAVRAAQWFAEDAGH